MFQFCCASPSYYFPFVCFNSQFTSSHIPNFFSFLNFHEMNERTSKTTDIKEFTSKSETKQMLLYSSSYNICNMESMRYFHRDIIIHFLLVASFLLVLIPLLSHLIYILFRNIIIIFIIEGHRQQQYTHTRSRTRTHNNT